MFVAPGNGGTARDPRLTNIAITDVKALADFAESEKVALTVVGPEAPWLPAWWMIPCARACAFSAPTKAAAQLESPRLCQGLHAKRHGIPTAFYETFSDAAAAHALCGQRLARPSSSRPTAWRRQGRGRGHVFAKRPAPKAIDFMLLDNKLGVQHNEGWRPRGDRRFPEGEEASFIVMADGKNVPRHGHQPGPQAPARRRRGPNTGGMGAYSPAPVVTPNVHAKAMRGNHPAHAGGHGKDGIPFTGFLYAGLMIDAQGNAKPWSSTARMGDPKPSPS